MQVTRLTGSQSASRSRACPAKTKCPIWLLMFHGWGLRDVLPSLRSLVAALGVRCGSGAAGCQLFGGSCLYVW
jgi:hypothetical protein